MLRRVVCVLALSFLVVLSAHAQSPERWRGVVDLSGAGAGELEFFVSFVAAGDTPTATITIPAQSVRDLPLSDVVYTDSRIEFSLPAAVRAVFAADRDGDAATGTLHQGAEFPLALERIGAEDAPAAPRRPQTPQPPFPYTSRDVSYVNPAEGNTLAGTLTVPEGQGPHPAALLITGSGSQDRDETIFDHKPFWVIADHLTRHGVAVLRVDDRGIGGSDGVRPGLTSADFAGDVAAGVKFLREQPEIDASRVGLIGHSEGGLIAPMVASEDAGIAFAVLLAGPGVPGNELLRVQNEMLLRAAGVPDEAIERQIQAQLSLWSAVTSGADDAVVDARLGDLLDIQLAAVPEAQRAQARANALVAARAQVRSAWLKYFLATDPAPYLESTKVPVLALNGTLDLQVAADQNLPAIEAALRRGGNPDVTVRSLEGLNHLFQHATTGLVGEYESIEETFAPEALAILTDWLAQHVGSRPE